MRPQAGFTPHVTTLGHGSRRALALHCTMAFGGAWAGLAKVMGDALTLIAPDMPSHGRSADWDGISSFSDTVYAASLAAMDDAPMDVIGHSFGAATALRLAVDHPEQVRSVTMIEPVFFAVAARDAPETKRQHDRDAEPFFEPFQRGDFENAARHFNRMWSSGSRWPDLPQRSRDAMTRAIHVVPDTMGFLYDDSEDMLGRLDRAAMPARLIRGADAHPVIVATNDGLARRLPDADSVVIDEAGHMAPINHPVETAAAIMDVLSRS